MSPFAYLQVAPLQPMSREKPGRGDVSCSTRERSEWSGQIIDTQPVGVAGEWLDRIRQGCIGDVTLYAERERTMKLKNHNSEFKK
ncbi:MAG: hypothetical protein DHS20C09_07540 [marine bacterium B5-7]|nr:MAG: hypothetical protein DHS20C09_07540 [marine bacterium B5-7]